MIWWFHLCFSLVVDWSAEWTIWKVLYYILLKKGVMSFFEILSTKIWWLYPNWLKFWSCGWIFLAFSILTWIELIEKAIFMRQSNGYIFLLFFTHILLNSRICLIKRFNSCFDSSSIKCRFDIPVYFYNCLRFWLWFWIKMKNSLWDH